jgi:LPS sulfotransferase NodH
MHGKKLPSRLRPAAVELTGAEYDLPSEAPAGTTVVICAGPASGSYDLGRFLLAAGVGIPHEYFSGPIARPLSERWGLPGNPLDRKMSEIYLQMLQLQRGRNGVFAVDLRYSQFLEFLTNRTGARLFNRAIVIHLFCPDIVAQMTAWRAATSTGVWDSGMQTTVPRPYSLDTEENVELFDFDVDQVLAEDTGFRKLFAMIDVAPILLTPNQLFASPKEIVCEIARLAGVEPDTAALDAAIAACAPAPLDEAEKKKAYDDLANDLKRKAFRL